HDALGMAGILFFHTDHSEAVRTTFRWQVKIGDFSELFLQQRYEYLVQCYTENGRFVWRFAGIGGMINRVTAHGEAFDRKDREGFLLVVIAGMVTIGAFHRRFIRVNVAFQYDFRTGGDL